ncbi:MAG: glycosyltransferase, partial [Rhodothermia bacterium]|nr:glycosyltransferase [Rhodothermia bacterium]
VSRSAHVAGEDDALRTPAISIVVAARNEESNLNALLDALRSQAYPEFEVIIVDDGSTDATSNIVLDHIAADARVSLVTVEPVEPRKKHAITAGINAAKHPLIALTDADCRPSPAWLRRLVAHYDGLYSDRIVIGYGPYDREPGFLNYVARFENFTTAFLTAAACGVGRPYMAVGRNISYSRELFDRVGGLTTTMHSLSGDDDLFLQTAVGNGADVVHMFGKDAFVPSPPPGSWSSWLRQKHRHTSAGRYYPLGVQAHIAAFQISGVAMWLAPVLIGWVGVACLLLRLAVQHMALRNAATHLHEKDLLALHPLWDLTYVLYNVLVAPAGLLLQPRQWRTGDER